MSGIEIRYPKILSLVNGLGRSAQKVGLGGRPEPLEELVAIAVERSGLSEFGDGDFRSGLQVFHQAALEEGRLSPFGRNMLRHDVLSSLENRLSIVAARERLPNIAEQEIKEPLFILGLPRTGTTILYELLSLDDRHRAPLSWELLYPNPPPTREAHLDDPRIRKAARYMALWNYVAPQLKMMHEVSARLPQECVTLLGPSFKSDLWGSTYWIPSYRRWLLGQDHSPAYRWHRRFLQHLQSSYRRDRWLLKAPHHLGFLDCLLAEYPDARVVCTHRDPLDVLASMSTLMAVVRQWTTDRVAPAEIGPAEAEFWSAMLNRYVRARESYCADPRIVDVGFSDVIASPLRVVEKIYEHFGWNLDVQARTAMSDYLERKPRHKYGEIQYSREQFGLSEANHRALFSDYCDRYSRLF